MAGVFIVIDGTDGSGKKTQQSLLIDRLARESIPFETISFPQYGKKSAGPVEAYLSGAYGSAGEVTAEQASILYAVDRFDAAGTIRAWLADGKAVIADRYVGSNMGHQGSKIADPDARSAFFAWNRQLEFETFGIPRPDLNVILHCPTEICLALIAERDAAGGSKHGLGKDVHEQDEAHLEAAEACYLQIAERYDEFQLVACTQGGELLSREAIHERVWKLVDPLLPR